MTSRTEVRFGSRERVQIFLRGGINGEFAELHFRTRKPKMAPELTLFECKCRRFTERSYEIFFKMPCNETECVFLFLV